MYKTIIEVDIPSPNLTLSEREAWARLLERLMLEGLHYFDEVLAYYECHECDEINFEYETMKAAKLDKILNERRQLIKRLIERIKRN